jgi:hypothetical protein
VTPQILFDFFGTLIAYSPSRTERGYRRSSPAGRAVFVGDSRSADYAGLTATGIPAYRIDPAGAADVPDERPPACAPFRVRERRGACPVTPRRGHRVRSRGCT